MRKSAPASIRKSVLDRILKNLVPVGATVFPDSACSTFLEGIPIPEGIRIRNDKGIELRFRNNGQRFSETVRLKPTVEHVLEVARKLERVQKLIALGKFGDKEYAEEFPNSRKLRVEENDIEAVRTVGESLDEWLVSRKGTFGQNSERDYELIIRNQLKPLKIQDAIVKLSDFIPFPRNHEFDVKLAQERHIGGPARKVDPFDHCVFGQLPTSLVSDVLINAIRNQLKHEGLGVKRIDNIMIPLRGALTRDVELRKLPSNPFSTVKPLKKSLRSPLPNESDETGLDTPLPESDIKGFLTNEGAPDPLSSEEMEAVVKELDAAMANQFTFAFWSGLRTGELIALRKSDLQLDRDRIMVRRSLSRGILKTTKTDKQRWVNLLPPAKKAIEAQLALLGAPDGWVFPNPFTKQRWRNESKITKRWMRAVSAAGIRYRRPYQTRHTYASMMLSAGENVMYVASQMGHADWSMLVKVYGHWIPSGSAQSAGSLVAA